MKISPESSLTSSFSDSHTSPSSSKAGAAYPSQLTRLNSRGMIPTPPLPQPRSAAAASERTLPRPHKRGAAPCKRRRGLDVERLPAALLEQPASRAFPEPLIPFPPSVAAPAERKRSIDERVRHARAMMSEGVEVQTDLRGMTIPSVLLQHTVEWEATKRLGLHWEEAKELQKLDATWARHGVRAYQDVREALLSVGRLRALAAQRDAKEQRRACEDEAGARRQLARAQRARFGGLRRGWERMLAAHLARARGLIEREERRQLKGAAAFGRREALVRNEAARAERVARVAVERAAARTRHDVLQGRLRAEQAERREGQMERAPPPLRRGSGTGGAGAASAAAASTGGAASGLCGSDGGGGDGGGDASARVRSHLSVEDYREALDAEHAAGLLVQAVQREAEAREGLVLRERSAVRVLAFTRGRTLQAAAATEAAGAAKTLARAALGRRAEVLAFVQDEEAARAVLEAEGGDELSAVRRRERRGRVGRRRAEERLERRQALHEKRIELAVGRAAAEQRHRVEGMARLAALRTVVLEEDTAREALAVAAGGLLRRVAAAERRAAAAAVAREEEERRRTLAGRRAAFVRELGVRMRRGGQFRSRCALTLGALTETVARAAAAGGRCKRANLVGREEVGRAEVGRVEDLVRHGLAREEHREEAVLWERQARQRRRHQRRRQKRRRGLGEEEGDDDDADDDRGGGGQRRSRASRRQHERAIVQAAGQERLLRKGLEAEEAFAFRTALAVHCGGGLGEDMDGEEIEYVDDYNDYGRADDDEEDTS